MYLEWHENESFLKRSHAIELITWFFHFKLYLFLFSPSDWHNLLQWYVLVWLVASSLSHIQSTIFVLHCILAPAFDFTLGSWLILWLYSTMPGHLHTMPQSDEDVQIQVEQVFGFCPHLWQICVVCAILTGKDELQWLLHLWSFLEGSSQRCCRIMVLVQCLSLWLMQWTNFLRQVFLNYLLILLTPFTNRCLVYCSGTIPSGYCQPRDPEQWCTFWGLVPPRFT